MSGVGAMRREVVIIMLLGEARINKKQVRGCHEMTSVIMCVSVVGCNVMRRSEECYYETRKIGILRSDMNYLMPLDVMPRYGVKRYGGAERCEVMRRDD